MGEHLPCKQGVKSSNLSVSTVGENPQNKEVHVQCKFAAELLTRVRALGGIDLELSDEDVAQDDFVLLTDRVDVVIAHRPDGETASAGWVQGEPGRGLVVVPLFREPLDVAVPLDPALTGSAELEAALYADTDGDGGFDPAADQPVPEPDDDDDDDDEVDDDAEYRVG